MSAYFNTPNAIHFAMVINSTFTYHDFILIEAKKMAADTTYKVFINHFRNRKFDLAAPVMFGILSGIVKGESELDESWEYKLAQLLKFLSDNKFTFDTADDFYDMLATIAFQVKKNPHSDWKTILN